MDRYEEALDSIAEMISDEQVIQNGRLPTERELSERLGIGRRVLRRALQTLEQDGKIVRHQGRGTFVAGWGESDGRLSDGAAILGSGGKGLSSLLDIANPIELIELRLAIEPIMCRWAALRSSRLDVDKLRKQAELTQQADNHLAYQEADSAFHRMIAEFSRNSAFIELQAILSTALHDTALERFGENGHCFKRQSEHVAYHQAIVGAIAERDPKAAEQLMREHLTDVHSSIFADAMTLGKPTAEEAAAE